MKITLSHQMFAFYMQGKSVCLLQRSQLITFIERQSLFFSENHTITVDMLCVQNSRSLKVRVGSTTVLWKVRLCLIPVGHLKGADLFSLHIKLSLHSQLHIGLSKQLKACFQLEGIFILYNVQ
jgi:hypothetical protein